MKLTVVTHSKPIREIKFNRDSDLVFTAAADKRISVWNPSSGERLGTYDGHEGVVNDIDVDFHSRWLLSGSGDETVRVWGVETGEELHSWNFKRRCAAVEWSVNAKLFVASFPQWLRREANLTIMQNPALSDEVDEKVSREDVTRSVLRVENTHSAKDFGLTRVRWSPLNDHVIGICSDGTIRVFDVNKEVQVQEVVFDPRYSEKAKLYAAKKISRDLTDIKFVNHCACVVTSRNQEAKMFDLSKWQPIRTYQTDRSLNAVAVHPRVDALCLGGGYRAVDAAVLGGSGQYECLLYHKVYEERMGMVPSDCFSPLNTMCFSPDGNTFAMGYEEGQARLYGCGTDFEDKFRHMEKLMFSDEDADDEEDAF